MSKVLKLLEEVKKNGGCGCGCLNKMKRDNSCEIFEKILEENKKNINFVFGDYDIKLFAKHGNKYGNFLNTHFTVVTGRMCLDCCWFVTTNYNHVPIGDIIYCYN